MPCADTKLHVITEAMTLPERIDLWRDIPHAFISDPKISQCTAYEKTILACASSSLGTKDTSKFMGLKANKKPGSHTKPAGYLVMLMC